MKVFSKYLKCYNKDMKSISIKLFVILVLVLLAGTLFLSTRKQPIPGEQVACTMEAKLCPDGSYVGRSGPRCEFAECPGVATSNTAKIGGKILLNGVYITPKEVVEDSRCSPNVVCIWAGQLRLLTTLKSTSGTSNDQDIILTLGKSLTFEGKTVELTNAVGTTFTFQVK